MENPYDEVALYNAAGDRLYLTQAERRDFMIAATHAPGHTRTLCAILHDTGCRISEACALTLRDVDLDRGLLIIGTLKQKGEGNRPKRVIPLPPRTLEMLDLVHGIRLAQKSKSPKALDRPLWLSRAGSNQPITRSGASRRIRSVLKQAGIKGIHANPKGLRHGFAINALLCGVPLVSVSQWLGHKSIETTQIYLRTVGMEDRTLAQKMWET